MRTLGLVLSNLAIALGILAGRLDYQAERDRALLPDPGGMPDPVSPETGGPATLEPSAASAPGRRSHRSARGSTQEAVTEDMISALDPHRAGTDGAGPSQDSATSGSRARAVTPAPTILVDPLANLPAFRARLDRLREQLLAQDFKGAEEGARSLANETSRGPISVHDKALALAARARVIERLVRSVPALQGAAESAAPAAAPREETVAELLLANGNTVHGHLLGEDAARISVRLENGSVYSPRKEDIIEVRQVKRQATSSPGWAELKPKVSRLHDPIDIFVDGVQRCFRLGLKKEGLELLEKAIEQEGSSQIALLFVPDVDEKLLRDWQVAAGRGASFPEDLLATRTPAASERRANPGGSTREVDGEPGAASPAAQLEGESPALSEAQGALIADATSLYQEAEKLYQGAVTNREGKGDDLRAARERLQKAMQMVGTLPHGDPEAKKLRRMLAQLISDVARASPF